MFNLTEVPEQFDWQITIRLPNARKSGNKKRSGANAFREVKCWVVMNMLDQDETDQLLGFSDKDADDDALDEQAKDADKADPTLVDRILAGFGDDVMHEVDGKAEPLQFSKENKAAFLRKGIVRAAVVRGYFEAMNGEQARRKN